MKIKGILLAAGVSCISLSVFAADQVIKEKTTPAAPEGAITTAQIPPVYSPPQTAPVKVQQPTDINQPVMPSNTTTPPTQNMPAPQQQPSMQPAPQNMQPGQSPQTMQGAMPQNGQMQQNEQMQQNNQQQGMPASPTGQTP